MKIPMLPTAACSFLMGSVLCAAPQRESTDLEPIVVGENTFHRRQLSNGLRAVAVRDTAKRVSVFMVISAGKRQETEATTGLAHLTEHAMYAGTKKTGLGKHDRLIHAMGGESNAFTREDYTLFYDHDFPLEELDRVLAMEADRLRGLTFDKRAVLFERERLRREEARTFEPGSGRQEILESLVFRVHPYRVGVFDSKGHTKAPGLDIKTIREFYDRYYQPDHTAVVVVGAIEPKHALDAIGRAFRHLQRGPPRSALPEEPDIPASRRATREVDLPRDRCNFVWLAPALGHPDRPALDVIARILARRTAADGSPIDARMGGRVDRDLLQLAATGPAAEKELNALVERARSDLFDRDEVAEVQKLLRDDFTSLPLRARPYFSLAGTFGVYEVLGQIEHLAGYDSAVAALNPDKLRAIARRHLDPKHQVTVVFKSSGVADKPLPGHPRALQTAAEEAVAAGNLDRAIAAYTRLLTHGPNKMFQVIYLSSRGQVYVKKKDYDGAIADYEKALRVIDYPAVRDLLREARQLQGGKSKKPDSRPTSRPRKR